MNKCKDCENGEDIHKDSVCTQKKFLVYKLKSYKKLVSEGKTPLEKNADLYKKVIDALQDGPLICSMNLSNKIFDY